MLVHSHLYELSRLLPINQARGEFMNEAIDSGISWLEVGGAGRGARGDQSADGPGRGMSRRPHPRPRLLSRPCRQAEPPPAPEPAPPQPPPVIDHPHSDEEREPGDWRSSRPATPPPRTDDVSEGSEATNRPTRAEPTSRYHNLNYWKARRVTFYRNGDPFHPGVEFRFKPGRDLASMDALLDRLSERLELPRGARFIFGMDGDRKYRLEELEDGASYVVSSYKTFKVRIAYMYLNICHYHPHDRLIQTSLLLQARYTCEISDLAAIHNICKAC